MIKVNVKNDPAPYTMFGRVPGRDFYLPVTIGDSLKEKWETDVNGGLANSSITVYDSCIFINDLSGWVTCLNMYTGKRIGQLKDKGAVFSSPLIENNILVFPVTLNDENYSYINFYNYKTGESISQKKVDDKILTEFIKDKNEFIFNTLHGKVYKYNFNGIKVWDVDTKASAHCSPAMNDNVIVFGNDKGEVIALNAYNGSQIYRIKIGSMFTGGVSISDSMIFIGDNAGYIYALELLSGNIKWKIDTGSEIISTPVFNSKTLFIGNLGGKLYAVNKENGKLIWESDISGVINATPLLTNNFLIVPNLDGELDFVEPQTGSIKKRFMLPSHARLSPLYFRNTLFIGYDNGVIGAYEIIK